MKHFYSIFVVLLVLFSFKANCKEIVTVYCDNNYPPYSYSEDGKTKGVYTKILILAFNRMEGYKVEIKAVPWKRGLKLLEKGKWFALYPPYYRPKKRPYMDYSVPILEEKLVAFTTKRISKKMPLQNWPKDFYGLSIGKNRGFAISQEPDFLKAIEKWSNYYSRSPKQ